MRRIEKHRRENLHTADVEVLITGRCFFGDSRWPNFDVAKPELRKAAIEDMIGLWQEPGVASRVLEYFFNAQRAGQFVGRTEPWIAEMAREKQN